MVCVLMDSKNKHCKEDRILEIQKNVCEKYKELETLNVKKSAA